MSLGVMQLRGLSFTSAWGGGVGKIVGGLHYFGKLNRGGYYKL